MLTLFPRSPKAVLSVSEDMATRLIPEFRKNRLRHRVTKNRVCHIAPLVQSPTSFDKSKAHVWVLRALPFSVVVLRLFKNFFP